MKAYKRFDKDMKCRGFQYHEGETYHEDTAELGKSGFHACEMPLDVLNLYPTVYLNIFREVELDEVSQDRNNYNTEVCAKTIRIGTEIGISGLAKAQIEYIESRSEEFIGEYATGNHSAASATGEHSAASATGKASVAMACGVDGRVMGGIGCALVAVERGVYDRATGTFPIVSIAAGIVDGENIKPGVWYICKAGKLVEI